MDPTTQKKIQDQEQERELQPQQQQQEHCSFSALPSECGVDSTIQRLKEHGFTNYESSIIFGNHIQRDQRTYIKPLRKREHEDYYYPGVLHQEPCDSSEPIRMYDFLEPIDESKGHPIILFDKRDAVRKIIRRKK